ncbi:hypothetical protein PS900_03031 [Pseudomonas fluorescens]|uniref:Rap1a immunity protein domain-containing protein n=1 Tax=Pseudomonas fluorescens TaxID=294 RepID=A0A8H2NSR0_PSEFL|nr:hypothetical protein [Pseudomonas fluorescens]VVP04787.1 hypothetical protein PS900_03031 [Pseudomonas fluorescens]
MVVRLILVGAALSFIVTAQAADSPEKIVSVYGLGGKGTCGAFIRSLNTPEYHHYFDFAAGFITAQNMALSSGGNVLGSADLNDAMLVVEKYCRENPMTGFLNGLNQLVRNSKAQ